jgi:hypothetical protein
MVGVTLKAVDDGGIDELYALRTNSATAQA